MACQALGRCRICARKHKIAVFGSKEAQHLFIEKSNLKLIILNTVCVECIGKIENFVKKMDLDMIFNDYIKEEEVIMQGSEDHPDYLETKEKSRVEANGMEKSIETVENSSRSIQTTTTKLVDNDIIDPPAIKTEEKSKEAKNKTTSNANYCNDRDSSNDCVVASKIDVDAQMRPQYSGDSQSAITSPHYSNSVDKTGRKRFGTETMDELNRKRPRYCPNILADKGKRPVVPNSKNNVALADSNLSSSSASMIAFVDCGRSSNGSGSLLSVRKGGRFLVCDFCQKEFTHAGDLNKHRRKHTGEKPYECNECKRKFAHASNLARHQRVHSGERPFSCPKCARTFTRRDKLMIHISAGRCLNNGEDNISHNPSSVQVLKKTKEK